MRRVRTTVSLALAWAMAVTVPGCGEMPMADEELELDAEEPALDHSSEALRNGTVLTPSQVRRLGYFMIVGGQCGAVLLSTSASRNESWLLTAAHCFFDERHPHKAIQPGTCETGRTSVFRPLNDGSGGYDYVLSTPTVCVHPNFIAPDRWRDGDPNPRHDLAVISLPDAVDVETPWGTMTQEYHRPVAGVRSVDYYRQGTDRMTRFAVFGAGMIQGGHCEGPHVGDNTVRFAVGNYEPQGHGEIYTPRLDSGSSNLMAGDSGGPWLMGPLYQWASLDNWLNWGVVGAVNSTGRCDGESWGHSTWTNLHRPWFESISNGNIRLSESPWSHTTCWDASCNQLPPAPPPECLGGQRKCGGTCTDLGLDENNCGECGNRCESGQECRNGHCRHLPQCNPPRQLCGTTCTNVTNDENNCGACGNRCGYRQVCDNRRCVGGDDPPPF